MKNAKMDKMKKAKGKEAMGKSMVKGKGYAKGGMVKKGCK